MSDTHTCEAVELLKALVLFFETPRRTDNKAVIDGGTFDELMARSQGNDAFASLIGAWLYWVDKKQDTDWFAGQVAIVKYMKESIAKAEAQ